MTLRSPSLPLPRSSPSLCAAVRVAAVVVALAASARVLEGQQPPARPGAPVPGAGQTAPAARLTAALRARVTAEGSNEPIARAVVAVHATTADGTPAIGRELARVLTDASGSATVDGLAAGPVVLRVRALGYRPAVREATLRPGDTLAVSVPLAAAPQTLAAVQARERVRERTRFEQLPEVGQVTVTGRAIRQLPVIGEPDVLRAAQLLAGVVARNDYTAGYNVRGGESDQNLVLLDGIPVYNPFHLGGLFGTFVDQAVAAVDLSVGGFAAEYGGRLSSVLDVRPRAEARRGVHGAASVSLLASSVVLGGALGPDGGSDGTPRTSWNLALRRTYVDALVGAFSDQVLPYHFQDAQGHLTHRLPNGGTLALTTYVGSDVLDGGFAAFADTARAGGGDFAFTWGNALAGLAWRQPWGALARLARADSAQSVQRLSVTRFATALDLGGGSVRFDNTVREARVAGQLAAFGAFGGAHDPRVGWELSSIAVRYDAGTAASPRNLFSLAQRPAAASLYLDDVWRPHRRVLARLGVRAEAVTGARWAALSPRASVRWFATPDLAVTLAGGQYTQWMHAVRNEDVPVRIFDFWVGSDRWIAPSRANHLVLGAERWLAASAFARVEAWGKQFRDIPEPDDADDPAVRGDEFNRLRGHAYGLDVLVRRLESERLSGWLAYGYAVSVRSPAGAAPTASGLSFQRRGAFWPAQDRRHSLNLVGAWRGARDWTWSARFGLGTGTPFTDIEGELVRRVYDGTTNTWDTGVGRRDPEPVGGVRNGSRYPLVHRLDLGVSRPFARGRLTWTPSLSIVNVYNRRNTFIYTFDYGQRPPTRETVSQFPLLPSVGLAVEF